MNNSSRFVKLSIELSEFRVEFHPRKSIRAQVLFDFISEYTFMQGLVEAPIEIPRIKKLVQTTHKIWQMSVDGSSKEDEKMRGVRVLLISPEQ